jgi:hypothetical protein
MSVALRLSGRAAPRRAVPCRVCFVIPCRAGPCRDVPCVLCVPPLRRTVPSRAVHALTCRAEPSRVVPRVNSPLFQKKQGRFSRTQFRKRPTGQKQDLARMVSHDNGNYTRRILQVAALAAGTARDAAAFQMGAPTGLADLMPPTGNREIIAPFPKSATGGPKNLGSLTQAIQPSAQALRPAARARPSCWQCRNFLK